ncbi:MAG: CvpA family protein [Phycisphaerales bacterium]|nr:CvpA family protein [Phycisphaerales bacterium]
MIFNVAVVAITLLIAYWWGHEGLFSSILHFFCVVLAGAIALAVWEPLVVGFMLKGSGFDDFAWGVGLALPFVISLVLLRLICDKFIPGNLNFPSWASWSFGTLVGLGSGILTTGILLIAIGFTQSHVELLGFIGWARNQESAGAPGKNGAQWIPVATWTDLFYRFLSKGALAPGGKDSLANTYPDLPRMALSLHRDTFLEGQCKTSVVPSAVTIRGLETDPTFTAGKSQGAYGVHVRFASEAFDKGTSLTLSASQVRLIKRGTAKTKPVVEFPTAFIETTGSAANIGTFQFDDLNNYASTVSGASETDVILVFPSDPFADAPDFIEIKGVRFPLPPAQNSVAGLASALGGESTRIPEEELAKFSNAPVIPADQLRIDDAMELTLSKNEIGNQILIVPRNDVNYLADGYAEFQLGDSRSAGKSLRVQRILAKPGTLIVKLEVSRGKSRVDLDQLRKDLRASADASEVRLIDQAGGAFYPIGYIRTTQKNKIFKIDSVKYLKTLGEIPPLPGSGTDTLVLLFAVTEEAQIIGVKVGEIVAGQASLRVRSLD